MNTLLVRASAHLPCGCAAPALSSIGALLAFVALTLTTAPAAAQSGAAAPTPANAAAPKVLRLALGARETSFDPVQVADAISSTIVSSLFDAPLTYDHLARPARLKPNTAASLPEVHDNYTRFVFRIKPGIHFSDHPAFKGQPRELTAEDHVYSIKRYPD